MTSPFLRFLIMLLILSVLSGKVILILLTTLVMIVRFMVVSVQRDATRREKESLFNRYLEKNGRLN